MHSWDIEASVVPSPKLKDTTVDSSVYCHRHGRGHRDDQEQQSGTLREEIHRLRGKWIDLLLIVSRTIKTTKKTTLVTACLRPQTQSMRVNAVLLKTRISKGNKKLQIER